MPDEPRQRWRVTFRRDASAASLGGRDVQATIEANLAQAAVPVHGRTQLATSLPSGLATEADLLDVTLTERWDLPRARAALAAALPAGHELTACHDVWLGEPALAAQARGAEYRVAIAASGGPYAIQDGVDRLLGSATIPRTRSKGERTVDYDLRPLLADVVVETAGPPILVRIAVRIDPERGSGRPEEVVAALADCSGASFDVLSTTRTRIALGSEPDRTAPHPAR